MIMTTIKRWMKVGHLYSAVKEAVVLSATVVQTFRCLHVGVGELMLQHWSWVVRGCHVNCPRWRHVVNIVSRVTGNGNSRGRVCAVADVGRCPKSVSGGWCGAARRDDRQAHHSVLAICQTAARCFPDWTPAKTIHERLVILNINYSTSLVTAIITPQMSTKLKKCTNIQWKRCVC